MQMIERNEQPAGLLHTPGGVRDIYGPQCAIKLKVEREVYSVMKAYGFRDIQTPTFEYFDVFNKERGTVQSKEMFKFFDRGNNTLALRPDVTPSIARCVAKYCREEDMQIRLCYQGNTFVNTPPYQGRLQEVTQVGAELFNDETSDADAEMIALMVEALKRSGLKEFQLEVGHADFFRGLVEEAGFGTADTLELRELIVSKNFFGAEEILEKMTVPEPLREIFGRLPELLGDLPECAAFVRERTKNRRVLAALDRLEKVQEILDIYGFTDYITVDFSMLSQYSYYTGVIFRAYTYGNGEAVATGGRYDGLVGQFGKEAAAIGLAIVIDQLMLALERQKLVQTDHLGGIVFLYDLSEREQAVKLTGQLRMEGNRVQLLRKSSRKEIEVYLDYARRITADKLLYLDEKGMLKTFELELS